MSDLMPPIPRQETPEPYKEMRLPDIAPSRNVEFRGGRWNAKAIEALRQAFGLPEKRPDFDTPAGLQSTAPIMTKDFMSTGASPVDPLSFDKTLTTTNQFPANQGAYIWDGQHSLSPIGVSEMLRERQGEGTRTPRGADDVIGRLFSETPRERQGAHDGATGMAASLAQIFGLLGQVQRQNAIADGLPFGKIQQHNKRMETLQR